jgi:hypothetical protein
MHKVVRLALRAAVLHVVVSRASAVATRHNEAIRAPVRGRPNRLLVADLHAAVHSVAAEIVPQTILIVVLAEEVVAVAADDVSLHPTSTLSVLLKNPNVKAQRIKQMLQQYQTM